MYYQDSKLETLHRVFDQNGRQGFLRLDLNENPGGLPREVVDRALARITPELAAQYPETRSFTDLLARRLGTVPERLCLTNGSAEGIRYILQAFTAPGGRVVGVVPSYFMFQVYAEMYGRQLVQVPYREDLTMDAADILAALTPDTQLLILLNPNNPMGNVYTRQELETLLAACRENEITVLIDEAYCHFWPESFLDCALEREHVFVTRTFSKLYSMAGARLGFVAGWTEGVQLVQKLCTPHNVNAFALTLAEEALKTPGLEARLVADFREGRAFLLAGLEARGYCHAGRAGNFLFVQPKTDAHRLVQRLRDEKQILVKAYGGLGSLGTCLRVTVAARPYMERFLAALDELDS